MKVRIIGIGIILIEVIAACDTTNSKETNKEFNPQVDGLWGIRSMVSVVCDDKPNKVCYYDEDFYYVSVDYPIIHACFFKSKSKNWSNNKKKRGGRSCSYARKFL